MMNGIDKMLTAKDQFKKAKTLILNQKYEKALECLEEGLKIAQERNRGKFFYNIALCQVYLGKYDNAIKSLDKAVISQRWLLPKIYKDQNFVSLSNQPGFDQFIRRNKGIYVRTAKWYITWISIGLLLYITLLLSERKAFSLWDTFFSASIFFVSAWFFGLLTETVYAFKRELKSKPTKEYLENRSEIKKDKKIIDSISNKPSKSSNYINLSPGSIVPQSGKWKCNMCGEGGIIDLSILAFIEKDKNYNNLKSYVAVKHFKAMLKESFLGKDQRKLFDFVNDKQLTGQETINFFTQGQIFCECPNCGSATGWTLLELTYDSVRKYRGSKYQDEDPQLGVYGPELKSLRDSIRMNNNEIKCYLCKSTITVLFARIEQWILNNRAKITEQKKIFGPKDISVAFNPSRDGAICKHCKGLMCNHCAEKKFDILIKDNPKCSICGSILYGIDHITD